MNKAFIFDMDGVIVNSETIWEKRERKLLTDLMGNIIYEKIKSEMLGSTTHIVYDLACKNGFNMNKELFFQKYDKQAILVYAEAKLTKGVDNLLKKLESLNFKVGLVTSSRKLWIEQVIPKLKNKDIIECILSLGERKNLRPKPYPDGYLEAIKNLNSIPSKTLILEDSNKGIKAAKSSGAFTICLTEHLPANYISEGADMYVKSIKELINKFSKSFWTSQNDDKYEENL